MVRNKQESYTSYLSDTKQSISNEIIINFEDFYNTIHNLKHKGIPDAFGIYDYEAYKNEVSRYCKDEYVSYEYFERQHQTKLFKPVVLDLNDCIHKVFTDEKMIKTAIKVLGRDLTPTPFHGYSDKVMIDSRMIESCISGAYELNKSSFAHCLYLDFSTYKWSNLYTEHIFHNLHLMHISNKKELETCIRSFRGKMIEILHNNKYPKSVHLSHLIEWYTKGHPTLNETLLVLGLIYFSSKLDNVDMGLLLQNHAKLHKLSLTESQKYCEANIVKMDKVTYTATKLAYMTLPDLSEHKTFQFYNKRRNKIIDYVSNIDENNSKYYKEIQNYSEKMTEQYFKKMLKRRAMFDEDYTSYAMRMNIRGYLPLPYNLWIKEQASSHIPDVQKSSDKELTKDLEEIENST